jgi:hypothetical protein
MSNLDGPEFYFQRKACRQAYYKKSEFKGVQAMNKQVVLSGLALMVIVGCSNARSKAQANLKEYLKLNVISCSERDGIVTVITDQQILLETGVSGQTRATVEMTVQTGPREGIAFSTLRHCYTLEEIDGVLTVVNAKNKLLSSKEGEWLPLLNFHREADPVFSSLSWRIA